MFTPIRNVLSFYKDPISFLSRQTQFPVSGFSMAHLPFYHITGLEEIKQVMVYEQKHIVKTPQAQYFTSLALGEGLVSTDGDIWLEQRKEANQVFAQKKIDGLVKTMVDEVKLVLDDKRDLSGVVSLQNIMLDITLRTICKLVFGFSDDKQVSTISSTMDAMIVETYKRVIAPVNIPLVFPTRSNKCFNDSRRRYDQIVSDMTEKALKNQGSESMASSFFNGVGKPSQNDLARTATALKTIVAAGHETTATTLTWLLLEISRHPEEEAMMKSELRAIDLESIVDMKDILSRAVYTQMVIKEILRMYPPIWLMGRMVTKDMTIGGQQMKAKDNILISPLIVHRLEEFWEQPEVFNPERFRNKDLSFNESGYFPFGLGPRQCIGGHLATLEMLVILSSLYQRFEPQIIDGENVDHHPYITLRPSKEILVKFTPIQE